MAAHLNLAFLFVDHLPDYMCDVNLAFLCVDHYFMHISGYPLATHSAWLAGWIMEMTVIIELHAVCDTTPGPPINLGLWTAGIQTGLAACST